MTINPYPKILHTADWHIGRTLYGRKRYPEFAAFLDWLIETLVTQQIEILLVAGDIFDTTAPSHRAQEIYYRFLRRVSSTPCRHVVIIAGNHDSPAFLNAPRELLKAFQIHIIGSITETLEDEILTLTTPQGTPELIVCAVPYLRDKDIRLVEAGEDPGDKEQKLLKGIQHHYSALATLAENHRSQLPGPVPVIAMGHLFAAGGQTVEGDGVRELYVGNLAHVPSSIFPATFDYVALGHLHVPQKVNACETIRYSGSPIPMGFGEANQQKSVVILQPHLAPTPCEITLHPIPTFQTLKQIKGDWNTLESRLSDLKSTHPQAWLEIIYNGTEIISDLRERLEKAVADTPLEILRIKNNRLQNDILHPIQEQENLQHLTPDDIFQRCLDSHQIPTHQRPELLQTYHEILLELPSLHPPPTHPE